MELEKEALKEIARVEEILSVLRVVKREGNEILKLVNSYFSDSKHFFAKKQFLESFEAAIICWAYIDGGLHQGLFEVPENLRKYFTV